MKKFWMIGCLWCVGFAFSAPLLGQIVVKKGKIRVAVEEFKGPNGSEASAVLKGDLQRSGVVDLSAGGPAEYRVSGTAVMGAVGAALVRGSDQQEVFKKNYTKHWRAAVHELADDIVAQFTGHKGIAGTRVAFVSKRTGNKELYLMDMDGGNVQQITKDATISVGPCLSRDGTQLAYTSYKSGYPDVYVIEVASGKRTRVAAFPGLNADPSFSPNGRLVALTLSKDGNPEIYYMSTQGGTPTRVTRSRGTESSACFAPDGDRIVYCSDDRGAPQLYIQSLKGGKPERLNAGFLYATEPAWSPDGRLIAFSARVDGAFQVCLYDVEGGKAQQLTSGGTDHEDPAWCRDSRHLVLSQRGKLVLLDVSSRESYVLENGFSDASEPSCTE